MTSPGELRERIQRMSDEDLASMLAAGERDYVPEALAIAREDRERRGGADALQEKAVVNNPFAYRLIPQGEKAHFMAEYGTTVDNGNTLRGHGWFTIFPDRIELTAFRDFKWTPRNMVIAILAYVTVIPAMIYSFAQARLHTTRYDFAVFVGMQRTSPTTAILGFSADSASVTKIQFRMGEKEALDRVQYLLTREPQPSPVPYPRKAADGLPVNGQE